MSTITDEQVEAAIDAYALAAVYVGDKAAMRAALTAAAQAGKPVQPVGFGVKAPFMGWFLFNDEDRARECAHFQGVDHHGLYTRAPDRVEPPLPAAEPDRLPSGNELSAILDVVGDLIQGNHYKAIQAKSNNKLYGWFVGQAMKRLNGECRPGILRFAFEVALRAGDHTVEGEDKELIGRMRTAARSAHKKNEGNGSGIWSESAACNDIGADRIATLTKELAEAREVIEPFAAEAETHSYKMPDFMIIDDYEGSGCKIKNINIGHLRVARDWLERNKP